MTYTDEVRHICLSEIINLFEAADTNLRGTPISKGEDSTSMFVAEVVRIANARLELLEKRFHANT